MIEYSRIGEMTAFCGLSQTREVFYLIKASSFYQHLPARRVQMS